MKTVIKMQWVGFSKILLHYDDNRHDEVLDFVLKFHPMTPDFEGQRDLFVIFTNLVCELKKMDLEFLTLLPYHYTVNPDLEITLMTNGRIEFENFK
jgi:hypothetical protein